MAAQILQFRAPERQQNCSVTRDKALLDAAMGWMRTTFYDVLASPALAKSLTVGDTALLTKINEELLSYEAGGAYSITRFRRVLWRVDNLLVTRRRLLAGEG